ncbi:SPW repeat domain-containing protein [Paenibacillus hexagrammi]|uniref:SPW repeat protein n=1 Tax=Paenibacillus hexagrammi TaxID=2908839 RepID=A0ABY3SNC7_9BACL|nr:SPW repeat protein [Paenibacillus sp. YPD9-1]UJF34606.1 SPW repeat protein [Paenibacillus sp. YPD9-1]
MMMKNLVSALLGLWFIATPWVFGFTDLEQAKLVCIVLGGIQFVFSLLAIGKSGPKTWQNWIAFFAGIWFIIFPNIYHMALLAFFLFVVTGFVTMLINYSNLYDDYQ